MLNKKVLLGALVAGAMVLPLSASAGVVSGTCVTCHTMHNSQDGATIGATPQATLLKGGGCQGCHAVGSNNAQGVSPANFSAPQVTDAAAPNLAGFFTNTSAANEITHNIPADLTSQTTDSILGNTPPGGVFGNTTCAGCHQQSSGGHHGQGGASYRMLFTKSLGDTQADDSAYGNVQGDDGNGGIVNVGNTTYDSDQMNAVCNGCHGEFHGTDITEQWDSTLNSGNGAWIRHPTDLSLASAVTTTNYNYAANYTANANPNITPLGTGNSQVLGANGADTLMCITCHFSHGSSQPDLLRFQYNATPIVGNIAGDGLISDGCESCHDYSLTTLGQGGM